jgi:hypothetical protein
MALGMEWNGMVKINAVKREGVNRPTPILGVEPYSPFWNGYHPMKDIIK